MLELPWKGLQKRGSCRDQHRNPGNSSSPPLKHFAELSKLPLITLTSIDVCPLYAKPKHFLFDIEDVYSPRGKAYDRFSGQRYITGAISPREDAIADVA